jgi:formate-dependent nitrite reductase cytochrome c552 subunit
VGAETCKTCHTKIHQGWLATLHAEALETLEGIGNGTNANCLGCHTVGFGQPGGFVDRATTDALAGVQCENCHGPALDHVSNVSDESLRPPTNISGDVCGQCHQGSHHPNLEQWSESKHSRVDEHVAGYFAGGRLLNSCGPCHSGDFRLETIIGSDTVEDDFLAAVPEDEMNGVTCAICHFPHGRTGNAANPDSGRDYQLRYPQAVSPIQSNSVADTTDPDRFNLCGQCHHSRGRTWTATSRGPHHSIQGNVYAGEMPMPAGQEGSPLVPNQRSIHAFIVEQCSQCHMFRKDFESDQAPAISGHRFEVDFDGCSAVGCHPSSADASASTTNLQNTVQSELNAIAARLGHPSTWEYESADGPDEAGQAALSDTIKKVRFLYHYILSDGSLGVHNPLYIRLMLNEMDKLLTGIGK